MMESNLSRIAGIFVALVMSAWVPDLYGEAADSIDLADVGQYGVFNIGPSRGELSRVTDPGSGRDVLKLDYTLPPGTVAGFVSGTSIATFCGLAAGRNELLKRLGWDVNDNGLFGAPPIRLAGPRRCAGPHRRIQAARSR